MQDNTTDNSKTQNMVVVTFATLQLDPLLHPCYSTSIPLTWPRHGYISLVSLQLWQSPQCYLAEWTGYRYCMFQIHHV